MLDENNSLLTALSEEEAATVCGGKGNKLTFTVNPDNGSVTVDSFQTGQVFGVDLSVASNFTFGVASPSPVFLEDTTPTSSTPPAPNSAFISLTGGAFS